MAVSRIYGATGLIGGATGALDTIDGADLDDKDMAIVIDQTTVYFYALDADSGAAESSPDVIKPDDNANDKRWILQSLRANDLTLSDDIILATDDVTVGDALEVKGSAQIGDADGTGGNLTIYSDTAGDHVVFDKTAKTATFTDYQIIANSVDINGGTLSGVTVDGDLTWSTAQTGLLVTSLTPKTGEVGIALTADGKVDLYYDNKVKISTDPDGMNISDTTAGQNNSLQIGQGISSNAFAWIDLIGDATYTDYGLRIIRSNTGANATSTLTHRGTGNFVIKTEEAGNLLLQTKSESAVSCTADGAVTLYYDNAPKFATATGGVNVTGVLECDGILLGDAHKVEWDSIPASDDTMSGDISSETVDTNATGIGALLVLSADGNWDEADADAVATVGQLGLAVEAGTGTKDVMWRGWAKDTSWSWTPGGQLFVSTTAGAMTQTAPSGSGDYVQVVGYATSATTIYFNPSPTYIEIT